MRLHTVAITSLVLSLPFTSFAASISQLVVFGDSLSDNGNAAFAVGGALAGNYAPNALTDGPNTTPATNGPLGLWIDQFAPKLGVADPLPFVFGGTNYAVASAKTGHNPAFTLPVPPAIPTSVPYITDQVALYLANQTGSPTTLYIFWAGSNDINGAGNPVTAADNISASIQTLAAAGAKQFLWLNEPPLGATPAGKASGQVAALTAATNAFNAEWAADIAALSGKGIAVTGVNVNLLFTQISANPAAFGFTNVTDPAWCGTLGLPNCAGNNPNQFLFWDTEHPTTAADAQIATLAFNSLAPTTGPVSAVPEPGSLGLSLAGFFCVAAAGIKLRRLSA